MKDNQPVTQREIDYDESVMFITKTDLKGVITYANDAFVTISGFAREELMGKSHNIVRHPDMPAWVFEDLWNTVKSGHPWRGIVKNRAKNGDHYWVKATVVQIYQGDHAIGYQSSRRKPTRHEVATAENAYRSPPPKTFSLRNWFSNLKIQHKVQIILQPALTILLSLATYFIWSDMRDLMMTNATEKAEAVAMQVIDSANMLMVTGSISDPDNRRLMIKKIKDGQHLESIRLIRTAQVVNQYGAGLPEEHLDDPLISSTIEQSVRAGKSQPLVRFENVEGKHILRVITPYIESHNFHGTDCLICHKVEVGSSNGASDLRIDLSPQVRQINMTVMWLIAGQIALQLLLYLVIAWLARMYLSRPMKQVVDLLREMSGGDLSGDSDIGRRDESGEILCSIQMVKSQMGGLIDQVNEAVRHISHNGNILDKASENLVLKAIIQSKDSHQMSSNMVGMSSSMNLVSDNSQKVHSASVEASAIAKKGADAVIKVVENMNVIADQAELTALSIRQLNEQSAKINDVVNSIRGISDRTNLLALNAAIEAARAGEAGRGFAVVADEVRSLSDQTKNSTTAIASVVDKISSDMAEAIRMIGVMTDNADHGKQEAVLAGQFIQEIGAGAESTCHGVTQIVASLQEQSVAISHITESVERGANINEENATLAKEMSQQAQQLNDLSRTLANLILAFKI